MDVCAYCSFSWEKNIYNKVNNKQFILNLKWILLNLAAFNLNVESMDTVAFELFPILH